MVPICSLASPPSFHTRGGYLPSILRVPSGQAAMTRRLLRIRRRQMMSFRSDAMPWSGSLARATPLFTLLCSRRLLLTSSVHTVCPQVGFPRVGAVHLQCGGAAARGGVDAATPTIAAPATALHTFLLPSVLPSASSYSAYFRSVPSEVDADPVGASPLGRAKRASAAALLGALIEPIEPIETTEPR